MVGKKSRFGEELDRILSEKGMSQKNLAEQISTSAAYVSAVSTGKKNISPDRIDTIARSLSVSGGDRQKMHRAAAKDMGFDLGLPDDFDD